MNYRVIILFFIACSFNCINLIKCQPVENDSIYKRIRLEPDGVFYNSSTSNCTIEWNCVDKESLRNKITFHNDQWFYFNTTNPGTYYLNIKDQSCRDKRGIQVLIIDGTPCIPSTYKYLKLHSMASIEDIYYKIENLKGAHQYLISIDGFLGDHCDFKIGISTQPPEYAIHNPDKVLIRPKGPRKDNQIMLDWEDENDEFVKFYIQRKIGSEPFKLIKQIPSVNSVYQTRNKEYHFQDSLKFPEDYSYIIVGEDNEGKKYLIGSLDFKNYLNINRKQDNIFSFKSPYKGSDQITFQLYDPNNNLISTIFKKNNRGEVYKIDLSNFKGSVHKNFKIIVYYGSDQKNKSLYDFIIE